mgnify:CR=1 FL=1
MLVFRILPCQRRAFNLWEFVPAEHQTLRKLYDMTHKGAWKVLFKASEVPPPTSEDRGLHAARAPSQVSSQTTTGPGSFQYIHGRALSSYACLLQDYVETAEQVYCPAPLPEGPADALLTEMLVPAPYKVPEKKADKKAPGIRKGLRRKVVPEASSEDDEADSSHEGEEEEEEDAPSGKDEGPGEADQGAGKGPRRKAIIPTSSNNDDETDSSRGGGGKQEETLPPRTGEEKKRKAAPEGEAGTSKKGKVSLPDYSTTAAHSEEGWLPRGKPLARS